MVKIQIDLDVEVNANLMHYMLDNQDDCLNEGGNVDKRIAINNILKEFFETEKQYIYENMDTPSLKKGRKIEEIDEDWNEDLGIKDGI